jgi:hypothetical protein
MTAKEFVKNLMPNAKSEKHKSGMIKGLQETYWLIRDGNNYFYFSIGKTESNAWVNAKKKLINKKNN